MYILPAASLHAGIFCSLVGLFCLYIGSLLTADTRAQLPNQTCLRHQRELPPQSPPWSVDLNVFLMCS